MKRTLSFMVMALALLLTQCRKPEVKFPSPVAPEGTTVSMTVTAGPGSKTDITAAGAITWSEGDKLYVGDGAKYIGCLTLQGAGGSATGTFSGNVTLTDISEGTQQTFHFFYLGSGNGVTPTNGAESVDVSFATQEIYANGTNLSDDAKKFHVGYGSAKGTVTDGVVTDINVTLVSKVALARFSFTKNSTAYDGALTLSGDNIYNDMTVNFGGTFTGKTKGTISLTGSHSERYVMLVPTSSTTGSQTLNFGGGALGGTTTLENGIESNKFYGRESAIAVTLDYEYVNLGLPSGLLWAICNLGASKPEEYGDYYQWGGVTSVTSTGINVDWAGCPFTNGTYDHQDNENVFTKYVPQDQADRYGYNGFWDDKTVLDAEDDAATVAWGSDWHMPTVSEFIELKDNTTQTWYAEGNTEFNGVAGRKFVGREAGYTDKYIFLPAAGYRYATSLYYAKEYGTYWSSSLNTSNPVHGMYLDLSSGSLATSDFGRCYGFTVRPVCSPQN